MILTFNQLEDELYQIGSRFSSFDPLLFDYYINCLNLGTRAQELFQLDKWNIVETTVVTLQPQKGNNLRVLPAGDVSEYFYNSIALNEPNFYPFSYSQILMYFKRFMSYSFIYHDKRSETLNLCRHYKAKQMHENGYTDQQIADYFGEKELNNIRNYIYSQLYVV